MIQKPSKYLLQVSPSAGDGFLLMEHLHLLCSFNEQALIEN